MKRSRFQMNAIRNLLMMTPKLAVKVVVSKITSIATSLYAEVMFTIKEAMVTVSLRPFGQVSAKLWSSELSKQALTEHLRSSCQTSLQLISASDAPRGK